MQKLELGDLTVLGSHPAKLVKAFAVIAAELHPAFDAQGWIVPGRSQGQCILATLAARDFLRRIGFADARARPVMVVMQAHKGGKVLHSLGIGAPETPAREDAWNGHLVVTIGSTRSLIDVALFPCRRPQWPGLTGMLAVRVSRRMAVEQYGLCGLAGFRYAEPDDGYDFEMLWLDNPANTSWTTAPDTAAERRMAVVDRLVDRFGAWRRDG